MELILTREDGRVFRYAIAADSCDMAISEFGVCVEYGISGDGNRRAVMEEIFEQMSWG